MQLNWSPDGSKWSLSRIAPVEDQPSLLGRFWRRLNNKPENNNSISIVKYGKGSAHRFLTALETDENITHETKLAIANRVVSTLNGDVSIEAFQEGLTVADHLPYVYRRRYCRNYPCVSQQFQQRDKWK